MPVTWDGLEEFRAWLLALPRELTGQAADIVEDGANRAADQLRNAYPETPTDHLKRSVRVDVTRGEFGISASVRASAPEAHLWEFGTQVRSTREGWNRGAEPAHFNQGLVGISISTRAQVINPALVAMVQEEGLETSGVLP